MKIDPKFTPIPLPATTTTPEPAGRRAGDESHREPSRTPSGGVRTDNVELSVRGRALASASGSNRMTEIRSRIQAGFYNDPRVAESVAHKLRASGEV